MNTKLSSFVLHDETVEDRRCSFNGFELLCTPFIDEYPFCDKTDMADFVLIILNIKFYKHFFLPNLNFLIIYHQG